MHRVTKRRGDDRGVRTAGDQGREVDHAAHSERRVVSRQGIVIFVTAAASESPISTASAIECVLSTSVAECASIRPPASDTAAT